VLFTGFERAGAVDDPDVVFGVDGKSDGLAEDPVVGKRLGPERVDFEARRHNAGGLDHGTAVEQGGAGGERHGKGGDGRSGVSAACEVDFHFDVAPFVKPWSSSARLYKLKHVPPMPMCSRVYHVRDAINGR
jgi:hypothetical protein